MRRGLRTRGRGGGVTEARRQPRLGGVAPACLRHRLHRRRRGGGHAAPPARLVARAADRPGDPGRSRRISPPTSRRRRTSPRSSSRPACTATVGGAVAELRALRSSLDERLAGLGLRAAVAGTHPFTVWQETVVSSGGRYQLVYGSMRELARREPTFALHVHVGVRDPETRDRARRPACAPTCRCCSPCRPTRRSGRGATAASPPRARRCSRRSRAWESRGLRELRRLRRGRRPAAPLRRLPGAHLPLVGRAAPAALRDRGGADHGRPDLGRGDRRRWSRWCSRIARLELQRGFRRRAARTARRCSRRTASSPPATAWTRS